MTEKQEGTQLEGYEALLKTSKGKTILRVGHNIKNFIFIIP